MEEVCTLTIPNPIETKAPVPYSQHFFARQPIMDRERKVIGYELLFRSGWENVFTGDPEDATRQTLDHCVYMGIESLVAGGLAFVNCTRQTLVDNLVTLLPPTKVVLEILETVEPDAALVNACIDLHNAGYKIALDDFVWRPEMRPLVELASYIKVDFQVSDAAGRSEIHRSIRNSKAELLAEKVETQQDFDIALDEGYRYFQGYFFCVPEMVVNRRIPTNRLNYLRLLVELNRKHLNLAEVMRIVQMEVSLCYRLLLLAHSPRWARRTAVSSVQEAFMLVGENRFRSLVSLAAVCVLNETKSPALTNLSLERARFCELIAPLVGEDPNEQFMIGLLSLLDATLDSPMESILKSLPLRAEAKAALMGGSDRVAVPLRLIRNVESGDWEACAGTANRLGISEETLAARYTDSVKWASESLSRMQ